MTRVRVRWDRVLAPALACAAIVTASCIAIVSSCGAPRSRMASAEASARYFLSHYVEPSGRVVRRDQGGDTVSEGQAYAMLLAVAVRDRDEFERVWGWTRRHLQRHDGLFSYRWSRGRVTGGDPAADADVDAGRALVLAARRFHRPTYARDAAALGRAILREETVHAGSLRVLVAGPWARAAPYTVDPSYFSPRAFSALGSVGERRTWRNVTGSSYEVLKQARGGNPKLPPDWAKLNSNGTSYASGAPGGASSGAVGMRYGLDAVRVPVRMAESCDPRAHRIAAAAWPFLRKVTMGDRTPVLAYDLSGRPLASATNPATLVAAAGAAAAAGDGRARDALLDRAQALDARDQTYYGDAWVALGRVMLQTDLLGTCAKR